MVEIRDLRIVIEHTGKTIPIIEMDASVSAQEFLAALAKETGEHQLVDGSISRKLTRKRLLPNQTFEQAGIESGETLIANLDTGIEADLSYISGSTVTMAGSNVININVSSDHLKGMVDELREESKTSIAPPPLEVLSFLQDLSDGAIPRYEAKLILVGEGGVGKSSLLRSLRNETFVQGLQTTHGIAIQPYQFPHPTKSETIVTLNVWDFGGQQIYHTTHQFFMTQRSLYLLVWNARGDIEQGRLDHWLRNIQVLAPNAPIILVATHVEERPLDFNLNRYKEAYPQIVDLVGVSNRDGTGIDELEQLIAEESLNLELMEQTWPKTWRATELALGEQDDYYLNHEQFTNICEKHNVIDTTSQETLGSFLNDLGKIVYFQDDDALADFIILKPNWLTRAVSRVLDDEIIKENKGVLPHDDFSRIWDVDENGLPYERTVYPQFLRLMERFLISFRLDGDIINWQSKKYSLIALHLPHTPPEMPIWEEINNNEPDINMVFRLKNFIPPGLMSWFIVLTHAYTQNLHWREGVRLQYKGNQAQVILNPSKRELWLNVSGPAPKNFFNILQHTINDRIFERFYIGLDYIREMPCNCHEKKDVSQEKCKTFFKYEQLVIRMRLRKLTIECEQPPFDEVSVPELLEGIHYTTNDRFEAKLDAIHVSLKKGQDGIGDKLSEMQTQLLQGFEYLKRDFNRLWNYEMTSIDAECPNTFFVMPSERWKFHPKNLFNEEYTLYLLCQHPLQPHPIANDKGYKIANTKDWFIKVAPWLKQLIKYLQYIPNGAIVKAIDQNLFSDLELSIAIYESTLKAIPNIEPATNLQKFSDSRILADNISTEGPALRALYNYLKEVDKERYWAGLHKTPTNDGNIFWLCEEHRYSYQAA